MRWYDTVMVVLEMCRSLPQWVEHSDSNTLHYVMREIKILMYMMVIVRFKLDLACS
jgi:hypothetical protein